jgi:hypothetical protein
MILIGFTLLGFAGFFAVWLGYFKYELQGYRDFLIWDNRNVISWDK